MPNAKCQRGLLYTLRDWFLYYKDATKCLSYDTVQPANMRYTYFISGNKIAVWPGGVVVRVLDSRHKMSGVQFLSISRSGNNLGQVVHARASVPKQYTLVVTLCVWEVSLALHWPGITDFSCLSTYRLTAQGRQIKHLSTCRSAN